jgi:hypothetical protein
MGVELNSTLNQFVNWASQTGIGKDDLVHAKTTQGATGAMTVTLSDNKGDGIGFFAARRRSADVKNANNETRKLFMDAVIKMFGKTIDDVPKSVRNKMQLNDYKDKGRPLSARRIMIVTNAVKDAIAAKAFTVSGTGDAVPLLKKALADKLDHLEGSKNEKAVALKNEMDSIAKNRFNMHFAFDMKEMQRGEQSQFQKDHDRMMFIPKFKIGNETLSFTAQTPLDNKNDIIAKFVKKDTNAKFSDLKGADLNKAYVVMSFLAQRFAMCMLDGFTWGLTPDQNDAKFQLGQPNRGAECSSMELSFGDDGSLNIHLEDVRDDPQITLDDDTYERPQNFMEFSPGSSVTCTTDAKIDAKELETICQTDYTKYDHAAANNAMSVEQNPNEAGAATMGSLRFGSGATFNVSFNAVLYGGEAS